MFLCTIIFAVELLLIIVSLDGLLARGRFLFLGRDLLSNDIVIGLFSHHHCSNSFPH